jgi:hydrogenase-4 component E
MSGAGEAVWAAFILSNFILLGSGRLESYARAISVQGFLLAALAWLPPTMPVGHAIFLSVCNAALKGIVFPGFLIRAIKSLDVRREREPGVGFGLSLIAGTAVLAVCFWAGDKLPPPVPAFLAARPAAFFAMFTGLFIIVGRRTAVAQTAGYLVLENGLAALGMSLLRGQPLVVELGVLLDLFAAVFIMGIAVYHINREFDHVDSDKLTFLRD